MKLQSLLNKYVIVGLLAVIGFVFWFYLFNSIGVNRESGIKHDTLSDTDINYEGLKSIETPNPYAPYFAGFDALSDRGVSDDDMSYIQDVLINFCLYIKHVKSGKISYVKDSFNNVLSDSLDSNYSFKFGINDGDIHTIKVTSNILTSRITTVIMDSSNKKVFERSFDIYSV